MTTPFAFCARVVLTGLTLCAGALAAALDSPTAAIHTPTERASLHIRVLNAHTGEPLMHVGLSARLDPLESLGLTSQPVTQSNGVVSLTVPLHSRISATVNQYPTCRHVPKADRTRGLITFPIDQILATGLVEANNCNSRTVAPTPGELTLFVRPLHWWERLSD